jgi:hypothetical protein
MGVEYQAQNGSLNARRGRGTLVVRGSWTSYVTAPGAFHRSPGPFLWLDPANLTYSAMRFKRSANRNANPS